MRILVLQLCRAGDILMTGPLLRGLRREYPSAELSLMVMDAFASTPLPAHLYDRLLPFPLGGLAAAMAPGDEGWERGLVSLRAFLREASGGGAYDLVVNLAHTDLSALIVSLVAARKRAGLVMRGDRSRAIDSPWMTYLRAAVRSREVGCFHLVDLFSWTAGVGRDVSALEIAVSDEDHAWAGAFLQSHGVGGRPLIAMQLGASAESKRWPPAHFAALADLLDPALGDIVHVGTEGERGLADAFRGAIRRPAIDGCGKTSLGQLAALLGRCRLLVTNDTGPMHVAAAVGTRVLDLSSGPVSAYETGPYGEGHVVVEPETPCYPCPVDSECHHFACRVALSPPDAAAAALWAMGAGPVPAVSGARLLQGRRTPRTGRIEFLPVGSPLTVKDRVRLAAADVWERTLSAPARVGGGWPDRHGEDGEGIETAADPGRLAAIHEHLARAIAEAEAAASGARALLKAPPAKVPALAAGVHARLERLLAIGESERAVHALVTHLRYEIDSLPAADLRGLAKAHAAAYTATAQRARLLAGRLAS